MRNITIKQHIAVIAAIGAATVFGMLSFGGSAQAAKDSYNCRLVNSAESLFCCNRMTGARLIDTNDDCRMIKRDHKRIVKRKPPRTPPSLFAAFAKEGESDKGKGGGRAARSSDKGPNSH